jgi:signal transduction histidine kinase
VAPVISCFGDPRHLPFHEVSMRQRFTRGSSLPGRVFAEAKSLWLTESDAALLALPKRAEAARQVGLRSVAVFPVTVGARVIAVLELLSDRTHPPSEGLDTLMRDVSDQIGRVLDREQTTARMADLLWREQQGLLHTLHDSLGQTLTSIGMTSAGLQARLGGADAAVKEASSQIVRQTQHALDQVRQLTRSLFPIEVEPESLIVALRELGAATTAVHKIRVDVHGQLPDAFRSGKVATELYRIAQEAVTNAVKHAQAHRISIQLDGAPGRTELRVADDGIGIGTAASADGMGLQIMRFRARSIGGVLTIEPGEESGTVVTCSVRDTPTASAVTQSGGVA